MPFLHKLSSPGWSKEFNTEYEAVLELRKYICETCLLHNPLIVNENGELEEFELDDPIVDVIYEGKRFECLDKNTLLSTSCGCEFMIDDEKI
jgi:hypothetical protein